MTTPPNNSPVEDLISRLEEAEVGSRELDCLIEAWRMALTDDVEFRVVGPPTYDQERFFCGPKSMDWIGYDLLNVSPAYTTSLDAALALVERQGADPGFILSEALEDMGRIGWSTKHPWAPQLAKFVCIALLKSLETPHV